MNNSWGNCPFRRTQYELDGDYRFKFYYFCTKMRRECAPAYCLGPDEDVKGDENEGKLE